MDTEPEKMMNNDERRSRKAKRRLPQQKTTLFSVKFYAHMWDCAKEVTKMKARTLMILALIGLIGAVLLGCASTEPSAATYCQISQEEAKRMMEADDGHVVVDVRRQDEYDASHIPGAILIPNESIDTTPPAELPDKGQIVLIYCRSGRRSKEAAQKLADMGYTNIYEFGGINTWDGEIATEPEVEEDMKKASLSFDSFDGGGPDFTASAEDPSILSWTQNREYWDQNHEELNGAGFSVTFTFTGIKPGSTTLLIEERSPIAGNYDHVYAVTVAKDLSVTLEQTGTKELND